MPDRIQDRPEKSGRSFLPVRANYHLDGGKRNGKVKAMKAIKVRFDSENARL
jgi:hypothetical protein